MKSRYITKKITVISFLTAISLVLSFIEIMMPILPSIPGGKLGIANVVIIIILYKFGAKDAFIVNVMRSIVISLIGSGASSLPYSLCGAVVSTLVMIILYKLFKQKISPVGISVAGAFMHNFAQVCVASLMLKSLSVFTYFTVLAPISIVSGIATGVASIFFINLKSLEVGNE